MRSEWRQGPARAKQWRLHLDAILQEMMCPWKVWEVGVIRLDFEMDSSEGSVWDTLKLQARQSSPAKLVA